MANPNDVTAAGITITETTTASDAIAPAKPRKGSREWQGLPTEGSVVIPLVNIPRPAKKIVRDARRKPVHQRRPFKKLRALRDRLAVKLGIRPAAPAYGMEGTIRSSELNGLIGVTCKAQTPVNGKICVRILSEGPHRGEKVMLLARQFSPKPRNVRRAIPAPPPRGCSTRIMDSAAKHRRGLRRPHSFKVVENAGIAHASAAHVGPGAVPSKVFHLKKAKNKR